MFGWFAHNSTSASRSGRARLRLEALEDRTVPSADPLEPPLPDPLPPTEPTIAPPAAEPPADPNASAQFTNDPNEWTDEDWLAFWAAWDEPVNELGETEDASPEAEGENAPAFVPPAWFDDAKLYSVTAEGVTLQKWVALFGDEYAQTREVFEALDANEDGTLTLAELEAATTGTEAQKKAVADTNWAYTRVTTSLTNNNRIGLLREPSLAPEGATGITEARWQAVFGESTEAADFFAALDANGDGTVTHDDIVALGSTGRFEDYIVLWSAELVALWFSVAPADAPVTGSSGSGSGTGGGSEAAGIAPLTAEQLAEIKRREVISNIGWGTWLHTVLPAQESGLGSQYANPNGTTEFERRFPKEAEVLKKEEPDALKRLAEIGKDFNYRAENGALAIKYDTTLTDAELLALRDEVRSLNQKLTAVFARQANLRLATDLTGAAGIADPTGVVSAGEAVLELVQGNFRDAAIAAVGAIPIIGKFKTVAKAVVVGKATRAPRKITEAKWGAEIEYAGLGKERAMDHIERGHFFNSRVGGKSSRFTEANSNAASVKQLVDDAIAKGHHTTNSRGDYSVVHTFDEVIGTDIKGRKTKTLIIYLDEAGNVKNAYPVPR
jgi:hypothetical protein